jgi:Ser/Thr protein kinase RdoA (MazF antagonist)
VPVRSGLINATFRLESRTGGRAILQRLHPVFAPEVNLDMAAVTGHLSRHGVRAPRLLATDAGALWAEWEDGVWRLQEFVPGTAPERVTSPAMAREAGRLVGRFHAALADFGYVYRSRRPHVHDTPVHLARLERAVAAHGAHRLYRRVAPLAASALQEVGGVADLQGLPLRHAHGDLKISNLLFDEHGQGLCLIDLDTLTRMPWPLEMGDALRSWCNPGREDRRPAQFSLELFEAALLGYRTAAERLVTRAEWEQLLPGVERICLELCSRFLADALEESYFGWDPARYPARGEHNLARAQAMWELYRDVRDKRGPLERRLGL